MIAKRFFDLFAALLAILLLWPVALCIAVAIRLDSAGPILFRQLRVGQFGRNFEILKFRTMRPESSSGRLITVEGDQRITSVGRFLRATKLDELPQFLNVLRGEMSLVGPRPEVPRYVALYPADVKDLVLSVRPGITDNASVEFRNEGELLAKAADPEVAYVGEILPRKLALYAAYARNRSFGGDMSILLRTLWVVVRH